MRVKTRGTALVRGTLGATSVQKIVWGIFVFLLRDFDLRGIRKR